MALLSRFGLIEVIGTAAGDAFAGRRGAVIFGRQGEDVFTSDRAISSDDDQTFYGGSGADTYIVRPGTSAIVGDGFGSQDDRLRSAGLGFNGESTGFVEMDGRHLVILDLASDTGALVLDWLNPERAIERYEFADGARALSAADVRSHPNYVGNFRAEDILDSPAEAIAFREQIRAAFREASQVETTPQPALVQIIGTTGDDELPGDARAEIITGLAGDDTILGDGGNDRLVGGGGADTMKGGAGADAMSGGIGSDTLDGGPGRDTLQGGGGADVLLGRDGADRLSGNAGDDKLSGGSSDDVVTGGPGDDQMLGGIGDDLVQGGAGADLLNGASGDDTLVGGGGPDLLIGGDGDDALDGGNADDELRGNRGSDTLTGSAGSDRFVIGANEDGTDRITDFGADDTLALAELIDAGPDPDGAALDDFLQFAFDGADTTLSIDRDGAGDFAADVTLVFQGVDLLAGAPSQAAAIDSLLATGQLEIT